MSKLKKTYLDDGTTLYDGFSRLLVMHPDMRKSIPLLGEGFPVDIEEFTTTRGRKALRIQPGNSHMLTLELYPSAETAKDFARRKQPIYMHERVLSGAGWRYELTIEKLES